MEFDVVVWVDFVDFGFVCVGEGFWVVVEVVVGLEELFGGYDEVVVFVDVFLVVGYFVVDDEFVVVVVSFDILCGCKGLEGNVSNVEMYGDGWRWRKWWRGCFFGCLVCLGGIMVWGRLVFYIFFYV